MRKSFHSKRSLFISTCLLLVSGFFAIHYSATTQAANWILSGGANWDTTNFINQDFWNGAPNTGDIIMALYGTGDEGTAYTQNWSGYSAASCLNAGMTVVETDTLPENLLENTIYVLTGEQAIVSGTRNLANCSAIVSKYLSGTIFYSNNQILDNGILTSNQKQYVIFDNISIDGTNDGIGGNHTRNDNGIRIIGTTEGTNATINNSKSYKNLRGIWITGSSRNLINNSSLYNNNNGLVFRNAASNVINNCKLYNNNSNGIIFQSFSDKNTINNTQTYNNNQYGIYLDIASNNNFITNVQSYNNERGIDIVSNSNYNTINNSQFYNNNNVGIRMQNSIGTTINNCQSYNNSVGVFAILSSTNNVFNTVQLYNNSAYGLHLDDTSSGQIYGTNTIFANGVINLSIATGSLLSGYASDALVNGLGRDNGEILTTGTLSWDSMTNPISTSGNDLLSWSGSWSSLQLKKSGYSGYVTQGYSYGSGIFLQQQPVIWSGTSELISSGTYDATKYIGSDLIKVPGELLGLPAMTSGLTVSVIGNSVASDISHFSLFGDIVPVVGIVKGTNIGLSLIAGDGQKRVVTQLFADNYFATHFQSSTLLDQTSPTFIFNGMGGWECHTAANLTINTVVDSGAGIAVNPYSFDSGSTWTNNPTIVVPPQQPGAQIRTGRVKDILGNMSYKKAIFTFSDAPPTGDDFTGNSNVGDLSKTANWKIGANTKEGWCGSIDIAYSGMVSQGTKGTCSVSGDNITYTPTINQTGNDSCTMQIKDNENNIKNITIYWKNIDTTISCLSNWDNDNFITGLFWNNNPTPGNVVCALYGIGSGDTTAYTQNWSGRDTTQCNINTFTVIETDNIPQTLSGNTIYILNGTSAIVTGTINMATCSAVISEHASGTTFFSTGAISNNAIFNISNKQQVILDALNINGADNGSGVLHTENSYGIYLLSSPKNVTFNAIDSSSNNYGIYSNGASYFMMNNSALHNNINNGLFFQSTTSSILQNISAHHNNVGLQISSSSNNNTLRDTETMDNSTHGIYVVGASNNNISNILSHNNGQQGILLDTASNTTISRTTTYLNNQNGILFTNACQNNTIDSNQSYNNNNDGIVISYASNHNTINNTQTYNNSHGITINNSSSYNAINNIQSYNNGQYGIRLSNSTKTIVNNVQLYNNFAFGILFDVTSGNIINNNQSLNNFIGFKLNTSSGNLFYGTNTEFANTTASVLLSGFNTGSANDYPGILTTGTLFQSGNISLDYMTNPINTSGEYFLPWDGLFSPRNSLPSSIRGKKFAYTGSTTQMYSYGSGILLQQSPIIWSGTTQLIFSGAYDPTKYIGSDTVNVTGELLGFSPFTNGINFSVTGDSTSSNISHYSLFGNITPILGVAKGTNTGAVFLTGDGTKRIITQLFGPSYFATHFENTIIFDQTAPTFTITSRTGIESTLGVLTVTSASDTGAGLASEAYAWSDDGINRGPRTGNASATRISHESTTQTLRVKVRDAVENIRLGSGTYTWTNTGPIITTLTTNGPTEQNNIITWTGAALDTGTTLSYRWYSGYDCLSNFLSSGTTNTTTGMLSLPGVLVRSLRIFDAQGSGGACVTSTGTWNNIGPTAQEVTTSGYEFTSLTLTGNAIGNEPLTYQWYSNNICTSLLSTGQAYTPPVQHEPITVYYYYQAFDSYGGVSACTTGTSIWKNVAPTVNNFQHTGIEGDELFFTASGYDPGGTVFTYQRYSGSMCTGTSLSSNETFAYTSDIAGVYVRSYTVSDAQGSGSACAVTTGIWNDITPPTAIITYSPTSGVWTSGAVLATITGFSEPISGLNVSGYTFTENGSFVFTFFDLAGNTGSVTATVDWIDSIAPTELTLVSPLSGTTFTTGNISLVRNPGVDSGSGISGYLFEINGSGYNSTGITFATGISLSGLLDGTYTRKIYARDSVGHTSLLSDVWEFVVSSSCTLPRGGTIAHGQHIIAYQANTVACGTTCASETRTCSHGTLGGTFNAASCSVNSCGGGGGGTTTVQQDDCTLPSTFACANSSGKDYSASYYDHTCCASPVQTGHAAATSCDVSDSPYTSEITAAFQRAFTKQITNKCPITTAHLDNNITRIEAAKMMSIFAMEVLGRTPNTKKLGCTGYNDIGTLSQEMNLFATTACQLGIMGLHADGTTPKASFDPRDFIDRAQFGTMLSRMLYSGQHNLSANERTTHTRYEKHLQALKNDKIITNIINPFVLEKRSWVLLMLHRVDSGNVVVKYRIITALRNSIFALFSSIW